MTPNIPRMTLVPHSSLRLALLLAVSAMLALVAAPPAQAATRAPALKDYIVTGAKPDRLFVIDAAERRIRSEFTIPDARNFVGTIVPSPNGRIAYVLVNKMESIAGIDLDTGRQVFRADLSSPGERVKCLFSFDVTPDGRELIVYELPVKLGLSEDHVEETRFAVFRTDAGVGAKPVRQFPAPRRVHTLLSRKDGKSFFAVGFELYEFDVQTGRQLAEQGIRNWTYTNHTIPDVLAFWPVSEPTGVFSTPVYSSVPPSAGQADPVPKTALMTLDLASGELQYHDFEDTAALIFSMVLGPTRTEAYGVYSQLTKVDTRTNTLTKRVDLDHTYYAVLVSTDGSEVYAAGAMCDVTVFDSVTLDKKANIRLTGCGDQSITSPRVIRR
ncbi:MAG TPA: quinohemoprotein amine dehydrogenase subunit beta [Steroidobacteraceae bacterium]|nr:quinohemoprotein amine dehydrogenase subunit beta [Steroidobacteraceae bacterium]